MLKVTIIQEEIHSYELLSSIIKEHYPSLSVVGYAKSVSDGIDLLLNVDCDLVFLDVQLEDGYSSEILETLNNWDFSIVFTTSDSDYAIEAFKVEAVDYLLKPYNPSNVINAIEKTLRKHSNVLSSQLQSLIEKVYKKGQEKISLCNNEGITYIDKDDIVHCKAEGSYCKVYSIADNPIMLSKTLGVVESMIDSDYFIRVHASHLVNKRHIRKFLKDDGGSVLLSNGNQIPVSRRRRQEVIVKFS